MSIGGGNDENLNEQSIWQRFVNGDQDCFKQLFKKYHKKMFGYGVKLCGQPELVKDCIQELFKTVWERRNELDHITTPNVYLFVSLRRKILHHLKKDRKADGDMDEVDEQSFIQFSMEEIIIVDERKHQQKEALKEALNQLSNRQREVIYLHYYNGMSYGEIEQILSINRQSVRNHVYRAMETLRTILDNEIMKLVIVFIVTFLYMVNLFI